MSKTIRFRVWDKDTQRYVRGSDVHYLNLALEADENHIDEPGVFYIDSLCPGRYRMELLEDEGAKEPIPLNYYRFVDEDPTDDVEIILPDWQYAELEYNRSMKYHVIAYISTYIAGAVFGLMVASWFMTKEQSEALTGLFITGLGIEVCLLLYVLLTGRNDSK